MVSADAANDASARMGKIHLREEAITVREKEVEGLKALLEQQLKSLQSIVGPTT
jgi:7-keto-8-aminopelargonate synthetase-like enzyme